MVTNELRWYAPDNAYAAGEPVLQQLHQGREPRKGGRPDHKDRGRRAKGAEVKTHTLAWRSSRLPSAGRSLGHKIWQGTGTGHDKYYTLVEADGEEHARLIVEGTFYSQREKLKFECIAEGDLLQDGTIDRLTRYS